MAVTRLSDVIVPQVFDAYMRKRTAENWRPVQSGILRKDANMVRFLQGGGKIENVPFWNDLADDEANVGTDDPSEESVPAKLTSGKDIAVRHNRNHAWSSARLAGIHAGDDPMKAIADFVDDWWQRQYNSYLVQTLSGVFADNAANDAGDMRSVIGTDAGGSPTSAELISAEAILDTAQTMGDSADTLQVLMMHSVPFRRLQKLNLIDFIPDSRGEVKIPTYLGYEVIVSDTCPAVAGSNRTLYSTYLVGRGAVAWAEVPPPMPVEIERKPAKGRGQGVDELYVRRQFVLHPYGIKWTSAEMTDDSPSNAELAKAANWDRVYAERKQVRLSELVTNG